MHPLVQRVVRGDERAIARAMTMIENDASGKRELLQGLYPYAGRAHVIGFTGSPGVGKSTLVDRVIAHLRQEGYRVGVLAVDPSSPFSGGALLGDRVRMVGHSSDKGVYIRSMGTRGSLGGLAHSTREMLYALEASGSDVILLETVGVGQSELDVMSVADTVALVLAPGAGDHVQAAKAGVMEIADVFVVNKKEFPGTDTLVRELGLMLHERTELREDWDVPIVKTSAAKDEGIDELWRALASHLTHIRETGFWQIRRQQRHEQETLKLIEAAFHQYIHGKARADETWHAILTEDLQLDPYRARDKLLKDFPWLQL